MDLRGIVQKSVDCIHVGRDMVQWWVYVNVILKSRI